jgi:putative redox protein
MDKSENLLVILDLLNDKLNFSGRAEGREPLSIDYIPPLGDDLGHTSLELLLLSLGSCMASTVLLFLRRMGKKVAALSVRAEAERRTDHPTILTTIHLRFFITSPDILESDFEKVLEMAEGKYCPVYAMINDRTKIITTCHICQPSPENSHS